VVKGCHCKFLAPSKYHHPGSFKAPACTSNPPSCTTHQDGLSDTQTLIMFCHGRGRIDEASLDEGIQSRMVAGISRMRGAGGVIAGAYLRIPGLHLSQTVACFETASCGAAKSKGSCTSSNSAAASGFKPSSLGIKSSATKLKHSHFSCPPSPQPHTHLYDNHSKASVWHANPLFIISLDPYRRDSLSPDSESWVTSTPGNCCDQHTIQHCLSAMLY
jgi:hypothetical protein